MVPCKPSCSSFLKGCGHTARTPQLAAELEATILSSSVFHNALSYRLDSALLKGCSEPWTGAEGTQTGPQLPSMGTTLACKERCGQMGPCTFQPLFLDHVSQLTPTELLWQQQQQGRLHSCRAAGPHGLGSQGKR